MKKLPDDAFAIYLAMGSRRSHDAVAKQFGVDKKTVTNRAVKEKWKERIAEHERKQREEAEKKARETLDSMNERQLRVASFIQGKAIDALRAMTLENAMDAVKAFKLAAEMERDIRGKPSQQSAAEIEEKIRGEHERWEDPVDGNPMPEPPTHAPSDGGPSPEPPDPPAE